MGTFISTRFCIIQREDESSNNTNTKARRISVANSRTSCNLSSDEYDRQQAPFNFSDVQEISSSACCLRPYGTQQQGELGNKDQLSCRSSLSSWSTSLSSFDSENAVSFDGLNKRANNRYEIGLEILKAQIESGADPKTFSTLGDRSCLMFSVMANDFSLTKSLVEKGVDINRTNSSGETALSLAKDFKLEKIAKYLRAQGATEVPMQIKN